MSAIPTVAGGSGTRRDRMPSPGRDGVERVIAQKVIHYWLQNRNQTLMPLTLNAKLLDGEQQHLLTDLMAAILTTGRSSADMEDGLKVMVGWLTGLGTADAAVTQLRAAVLNPAGLGPLIERAKERDLAAYAYVGALIASDDRYPASMLVVDLLATRLDLPSAMIRSAVRRYRR